MAALEVGFFSAHVSRQFVSFGAAGSHLSSYLNVDGSSRELLLEIRLEVFQPQAIPVDYLPRHCCPASAVHRAKREERGLRGRSRLGFGSDLGNEIPDFDAVFGEICLGLNA